MAAGSRASAHGSAVSPPPRRAALPATPVSRRVRRLTPSAVSFRCFRFMWSSEIENKGVREAARGWHELRLGLLPCRRGVRTRTIGGQRLAVLVGAQVRCASEKAIVDVGQDRAGI